MKRAELNLTLALANEFKEGDLAVGGTCHDAVRSEARVALAALRLADFNSLLLLEDGVSLVLESSRPTENATVMTNLSVGELRQLLLGASAAAWVARYGDGLSSEAIAAVVKIMTDVELASVARALQTPLPGRGLAIGAPGHFGSRIQPNSAGDDEEEILFSVLEGLTYGCGDVILGLNPASDDLETIVRLEDLLARIVDRLALPTRYCVLSDIIKQTRARQQTRVEVGFQSLAGTTKSLKGMVGLDAEDVADLARGFDGLYFETGQGSEVTNGASEGIDMTTLEARTYGVARYIRRQVSTSRGGAPVWMIVNDVAGFIGPEVFRNGKQLRRACLEDLVMARLHGLTMGLDVCATFHMGIDPAELARLTTEIVQEAAPAYLMSVAGNADPMLGYMTTSYRQHPRLRAQTGRDLATEMADRLAALDVWPPLAQGSEQARTVARLYARYAKAGGETRDESALESEGLRKLRRLRERGSDLGYGYDDDFANPAAADKRLDAIYRQARRALYARLDVALLDEILPTHLRVRSAAVDRDDYLSHPAAGERISAADVARIRGLYSLARPAVQVIISDGLNADAVNENLRQLWPPLNRALAGCGGRVGARQIVVDHGRVRVGYEIGALLDVDVIVHLIGERPGTGIDTLSAYLTYGRDERGQSRWSPTLDHAQTTAICGIHRRGKDPLAAAEEIAKIVKRMLAERRSGVALGAEFERKRNP
jgi:ethanolamine ammonia-lyase large subunit